ncbi:hypothetical protein [Streptomyces sp. G1]|uniref:hypothetical protein n=1 Tax=Streptomyces sp. G1 TaxID=361572 RepID=UPI00202EF11F|nr:hypothetical protein [Streptomyces sp. G1]MCM1976683.1 hypothetical protein [Streptomyces sp. G1]
MTPTGPTGPVSPGDATAAAAPHTVEFLRRLYPGDEPERAAWGVRIDGTDLRALVAEATRAGWSQEWDTSEKPPDGREEREERLMSQHAPLVIGDDAHARRHFLGDPDPERREPETGAMALLGCICGTDACWPMMATVTVTAGTVTWSGFHQPYRPEWGVLAMGPYAFPRTAYEQALAAPLRLPGRGFLHLSDHYGFDDCDSEEHDSGETS